MAGDIPDFYTKQTEFIDNSEKISEVQNDKVLLGIMNDYLKKNNNEGVDESLVNFINAKGDKKNVITYITYIINDNPNNLSNDDLLQLGSLKVALMKNELASISQSVEMNNNYIDFKITGGYIDKKFTDLGLFNGGPKKENRHYALGHTEIVQSSKGENIFEIHLNTLNNEFNQVIEIEYYGDGEVFLIDRYGRNNNIQFNDRGRQSTLDIKYNNELIHLNVDFYRNHHRYNRKDNNQRNYQNNKYR